MAPVTEPDLPSAAPTREAWAGPPGSATPSGPYARPAARHAAGATSDERQQGDRGEAAHQDGQVDFDPGVRLGEPGVPDRRGR